MKVSAPTPAPGDKTACSDFFSLTPRRVDEQMRREISPAGASARAWGDPAIVATCGGSMPSSFNAASACTETDGVGWYVSDEDMSDQSRPVTMTTIGWTPVISVTIPASYRPEGPASVMADLADAVKRSLHQDHSCV